MKTNQIISLYELEADHWDGMKAKHIFSKVYGGEVEWLKNKIKESQATISWQQNMDSEWETQSVVGEAESEEEISLWNLGGVFSSRLHVRIYGLPSPTIRYWMCAHRKDYWPRIEPTYHKQPNGKFQNYLAESSGSIDANPLTTFGFRYLKAGFQVCSPSPKPHHTCVSNIFLFDRAPLAPSEQSAEEAGMRMKE